jgi:signal transduction histidine kinase
LWKFRALANTTKKRLFNTIFKHPMTMRPPPSPLEKPVQALRLLHLEDSEIDHQLVCKALQKEGLRFSIARTQTIEEFVHWVKTQPFDLLLADYRLAGFTALDAWAAIADVANAPPCVLLSGTIGESAAVQAIHHGISDYLHKDELRNLRRVIERALAIRQAQHAAALAAAELAASEQRLAQFAEHLQNTIEQERAAIAREIHDDIGGALAAVKLDLSWIGRHETAPATQTHLQAAHSMLQHAMGASQRIMMNLRPAILDQGLLAALQWLSESFHTRTGIKATVQANHASIQTNQAIALTAYRTAQEALTNASKHAQCSQVKIELSDAEGVLTLEISDNGQGISPEQLQKPTAFGIRGLKERAKVVGGWLDISSQVGQGTSLILSIPLNQDGKAASENHFHD